MGDWVFLPTRYLLWHYSAGWRDFFSVGGNFLWFEWHFFSVSSLLRHFFSPWKRLGEAYPKNLNPQAFLETLIVNVLMRAVGLTMRTVLLLIWLIVFCLSIAVFAILTLVWLVAPFIPIALALTGFYLLTT